MAVDGKTAGEISARAEVFNELAHDHMWSPDCVLLDMSFPEGVDSILAETYFAISEAYKRVRLKPTSRTDWTKAAAFVAISVSLIEPFVECGKTGDSPLWAIVNPMFGMTCAYGHSKSLFHQMNFDEKHRVYRALAGLELPSVYPVIEEGYELKGRYRSRWNLTFSEQEMSTLDLWVAYFVSMDNLEKAMLARGRSK